MTRINSPSPGCLTPEVLSALAAGAVSGRERDDALAHLATCSDCREVFVDVTAFATDVPVEHVRGIAPSLPTITHATVPADRRSRRGWYAGAAAAVIVVAAWSSFQFLNTPDRQLRRAVSTLAQSVQTERSTEARLAGGFVWRPAPVNTRGTSTRAIALPVQEAVLAIRKLADGRRTARSLDAVGVADLVTGDIDAALRALDDAVEADGTDINARIDLTAARLERWRRSREAIDAASAADAAQRALVLAPRDPLALFNHALASEALGVPSAAILSWQAYLTLDPSSKWADEARQHLAQLERGGDSAAALPAISSLTTAELADAATLRPATLEHYLDDTWLQRWRSAPDVVSSDATFAQDGERVSAALISAQRDRYLPDAVTKAIALSQTADATRLRCLVDGTAAISSSLAASGQSRTSVAESDARRAHSAFACAGFSTIQAEALIGWSRFAQDHQVEGVSLLKALAPAAEAAGYSRAAARAGYVEGLLDVRAGRLSSADDAYVQALRQFERAGDTGFVSVIWTLRAEVAQYEGDDAHAWNNLSRALGSLSAATVRQKHMAFVTASIQAGRQGLQGTSSLFADMLTINASQSSDPAIAVGSYLQSAKAELAFGQRTAALAALDQVRAVFSTMSDATMRSQYALEVSELEGRILTASDPARAIESFTSAMNGFGSSGRELRRAELFLDLGRAHQAAGDPGAADNDWMTGIGLFEDQRPSIRDAQLRIDRQDRLWDLFREAISIRSGDALRSLEIAERFRGRALLDAMSNAQEMKPLSGTAMHDWLPADVTAIAYAVLPDRLLRWTITTSTVRVDQESISSRALANLVDECRGLWLQPNDAALDGNASIARLARMLVPAGLSSSTTKRLVFLPDGVLFDVPFAALPSGANRTLIVDDFIPSVSPSLTILKLGARARVSANSRALLIASAEAHPSEGLPALPGAAAEMHAVAQLYESRDVLEGAAATRTAMLRSLAHADVIHFAGHAIADAASPSRSRLLLSPASPLAENVTFDDLRSAALRPSAVVVLSACDGARGRIFRGEGAVGLTYPFLANGAAGVVAAIWREVDTVPAALWRQFHSRLLAGAAPDAALAESQRLIRRNGSSVAVWAAFESVGGLARQ